MRRAELSASAGADFQDGFSQPRQHRDAHRIRARTDRSARWLQGGLRFEFAGRIGDRVLLGGRFVRGGLLVFVRLDFRFFVGDDEFRGGSVFVRSGCFLRQADRWTSCRRCLRRSKGGLRERFKFLEARQLVEIGEAEAHHELFRGPVENRAADNVLAAGGGDQAFSLGAF